MHASAYVTSFLPSFLTILSLYPYLYRGIPIARLLWNDRFDTIWLMGWHEQNKHKHTHLCIPQNWHGTT